MLVQIEGYFNVYNGIPVWMTMNHLSVDTAKRFDDGVERPLYRIHWRLKKNP